VKLVAQEKNKKDLPEIENVEDHKKEMVEQWRHVTVPNHLPGNPDAFTLTNPNFQVYSEEIKKEVEEQRKKIYDIA